MDETNSGAPGGAAVRKGTPGPLSAADECRAQVWAIARLTNGYDAWKLRAPEDDNDQRDERDWQEIESVCGTCGGCNGAHSPGRPDSAAAGGWVDAGIDRMKEGP
jgi:hypothetical protein